jgi:hypothetical protein
MTPAEKLSAFTTETGALFPFSVVEVHSLDDWEPVSQCIAICGDQYRINEADTDNIVGQSLTNYVNELVGDELNPWTPETGVTEDATT